MNPNAALQTPGTLAGTTQANFQANVAATPAPGAAPATPNASTAYSAATQAPTTPALAPQVATNTPTPSAVQSVDATGLGQPTLNASQLPPQQPYTPSAVPDLTSIINQGTAPSQDQQTYNSLGDQIGALTASLGGQGSDYSSLQSQYQVPQLTATSNDIAANIAHIQAQRDSMQQSLKAQYGNDASKGYLNFEQQNADSYLSSLQSASTATLAAINGKLSTAQTLIDKAISNKYDPINNQINALKSQADLVSKTLDRQQTKQLAVMNAQLADRTAQIAQNKAIASTMLEKIATAAANPGKPAPAYIVAQAQKAALSDNPSSALDIISPYLTDPLAAQKELADIAHTKAGTVAEYASAAASKASASEAPARIAQAYASAAASRASAAKDVQQANLYKSQAASYNNPNLIAAVQNGEIDPSKINSRNMPIMAAFANAHVNVNQLSIDAASAKKVQTNLSQQASQITQAGTALEKNMSLLAGLSDKVNKLGIPAADTALASWQSKYSNQPDVVNYLSTLSTVRAEYAKYIARGSQVDDSTKREAAGAIPVGVNGDTLKSLLGVIQTEGKNVQDSIKTAKAGNWNELQGGSSASTSYDAQAVKASIPNGQIAVTRNGVPGYIPASEFDPKTDKKI